MHQSRICPVCKTRFVNTCALNAQRQNLTCSKQCRDAQRVVRRRDLRAKRRAERITAKALAEVGVRKRRRSQSQTNGKQPSLPFKENLMGVGPGQPMTSSVSKSHTRTNARTRSRPSKTSLPGTRKNSRQSRRVISNREATRLALRYREAKPRRARRAVGK